jgi:hypothetical protein
LTVEVIRAESQAVLNSILEIDFQDAFKNCRNVCNSAYMQNGTASRVMVASRPKVGSQPDHSTSPRDCGYHFISALYNKPRCCIVSKAFSLSKITTALNVLLLKFHAV